MLELKRYRSHRTRLNAAWQFRRLSKAFGRLRVDEIDESLWLEYVERENARRPRKFAEDRKFMRQVLRYAFKKRLVPDVIDLPIPDSPEVAGRALSSREVAALEKHATPTLRFQIQIAWRMGLRLGELLRLRWSQIDLDEEVIRLGVGDTKTRRARVIPIPPILLPEFRRRRVIAPCQWLFWNPSLTGPVSTNQRAWRRCKKRAGVTARWQDLRHTCATIIVRKNFPVPHGAKYLGNSPVIFALRYTHPDLKDLRRIAKAMS